MPTLTHLIAEAGAAPSRWLDLLTDNVIYEDGNQVIVQNEDDTLTLITWDSLSRRISSMEHVEKIGDPVLARVTGLDIDIDELFEELPDGAYFILGDGATVNVSASGIEDGAVIWNYAGADTWNIGSTGITVFASDEYAETFLFSTTVNGPIGETVSYQFDSDGSLNYDPVRLDLSTNGLQEPDFARQSLATGITLSDPFAQDNFNGVNHAIGSEGADYIRGAAWVGNTVWLNVDAGNAATYSRVGSTIEGGGGDDTIHRAYIAYGGDGDDYITAYAGGELFYHWTPGAEDYPNFGVSGNVFPGSPSVTGGPPTDNYVGGGHAHGGSGDDTFQMLPGTTYVGVGQQIRYYIDGGTGSDWINGATRLTGVNSNGVRSLSDFDAPDFFSGFGIYALDVNLLNNAATLVIGLNTTSSVATQIVYEVHNVENVRGTDEQDRIIGDDEDNIIEGDAGADALAGRGGNDTLSYENSDAAVNVDFGTPQPGFGGGEATVSGGHAEGDQVFQFENIRGSAYGDVLIGDEFANEISGLNGDDEIDGGGGDDVLDGGVGDDIVDGGDGDDVIVNSGGGEDTFNGGAGSDTLITDVTDLAPDFTLLFDANLGIHGRMESDLGRDTINSIENFTMIGNWDAEVIGNGSANFFVTGSGDDRVFAGGGADQVYMGAGNDYVRVGGGVESFDGGEGTDYISYYDSSNGITADLQANTVSGSWAVNDTINSFEGISGSRTGDDVIYGTSGANVIRTYGGDDRVFSRGGTDTVELGSGDDYVRVGGGAESFDGGSGTDYISYYDSSNGITANLAENTISGSWAVNDTINSFEGISGSRTGDDDITGTSGANIIRTYGGNDRVYAGGGSDVVELGSGNDYVRVGGGAESFDGGSGTDYISYYDSSNGINIDLAADTVSGSWAVNDTIANFESASGSGTGDDRMYGTSGSNTLKGFGGDDKLYGRSGDDKLYGGSGSDRFDGGAGTDQLWGGKGEDVFHLDFGEGHDIIEDFEGDVDVIQLDNFSFGASEEAFDFAEQVGDDVIFDFGNGDGLTVRGVTIAELENDLVLV